MCKCILCNLLHVEARRGHQILWSRIGVTDHCEHPCWELNSGSVQEQQRMLRTAEPSLQPAALSLKIGNNEVVHAGLKCVILLLPLLPKC